MEIFLNNMRRCQWFG